MLIDRVWLSFELPTSSLGCVGDLVDKLGVFYNQIAGTIKLRHGGREERTHKGCDATCAP